MLGITIILSTYNRASDLEKTLDAFCLLNTENIHLSVAVVDNNSNDNTSDVIKNYKPKLPIVHLFESKPGKNSALNHALNTVELNDIVVFTDDDVTPEVDWLQAIALSCENWTDYSVFGGKIKIMWPKGVKAPELLKHDWFLPVFFAEHDYGNFEGLYPDREFPFGPNFWVRSSIFNSGIRFNENIGPRPTNRLMGSETSFLIDLQHRGFKAVHVSAAIVQHRIQKGELNEKGLKKRAFRFGRSGVHLLRMEKSEQYKIRPIAQALRLLASSISYLIFCFYISEKSLSPKLSAIRQIGFSLESIRLFLKNEHFK